MKNIFKIILLITAISSIIACGLLEEETATISNEFLQNVLETNGDGHFKSDYTYTMYYYGRSLDNFNNSGEYIDLEIKAVAEFKSDGTFNWTEYGYEKSSFDLDGDGISGEGYMLISHEKGTYSYKDYKLTSRYKEYLEYISWYYDEDLSYGYNIWNNNPERFVRDYDWVRSGYYYISENIYEGMYKSSGNNTWINEWTYYTDNGEDEPSTSTNSFVITNNEIRYNFNSSYREEEEVFEVFEMFPKNSEFKEGSIIKFNGIYTTSRSRYYDYENEVFGEWENNDWSYENIRDMSFAHMGDFIVYNYVLTNYSRESK